VEDALNFTWHVERPRSLAKRLSEYLVIMLIGPVVAVAAMVLLTRFEASDAIARFSGLAPGAADSDARAHFTPYVLIIGLFWFLYYYMPNTRVRWQSALIGALFGGTAWVAVGAIFTRIVLYSAKAAAIYAGFAVVLLFLVWLHLSWLVMLLGGQLSFYTQHPEHLRTGQGQIPTTAGLRERIAMGAMYLLAERFIAGGPRWRVSDLADRMDVPASVLDEELSLLEDRGLVLTAEDDTVAPGRDLSSITLADILDAIRHETPNPRRPEPVGVPVADAATLAADRAMRESMSQTTLRDLVEKKPARPETCSLGASHPVVIRRDAVNPSLEALGSASMPRTARRMTTGCLAPARRRCTLALPTSRQSPAIVISSIRTEPVRMPPRTSMSAPTSTMCRYMSFRFPAIVTSCTG
jgi:membrane protein